MKPPIMVKTIIKHSTHPLEYVVQIRGQFSGNTTATVVSVTVPVSKDVDTPQFDCTKGKVEYKPELDAFVWTIKQLQGRNAFDLLATFGLPSITHEQDLLPPNKPVQLAFELPNMTASRLQVQSVKVIEKTGYQAHPWVRYRTSNGQCQFRLC